MEEIDKLTTVLNLKKKTIYKWFWDTIKREKARNQLVENLRNDSSSYTDEFSLKEGSEPAADGENVDGEQKEKDEKKKEKELDTAVEGKDGNGQDLRKEQITNAL